LLKETTITIFPLACQIPTDLHTVVSHENALLSIAVANPNFGHTKRA